MKKIIINLIGILLLSCGNTNIHSQNVVIQDTVMYDNTNTYSQNVVISQDTVITISQNTTIIIYSIENISSEGAEAIIRYVQGRISLCKINIYGEMGRANLIYKFSKNMIKVTEKDYNYEVPFMQVTDKDIKLIKNFSYKMDLNGVLLEKVDSDRIDIFQELKDAVPFVLK